MTDTALKSILKEFEVKSIIQFGNIAETSKDVDILIVSDNFEGVSDKKRRELICKIDANLDPVCLTTNEYNNLSNANSSILKGITSTSKIIYGYLEIFS